MRKLDGRLDIIAQWRLLALEAFEGVMCQYLVDGAHAIGAFGMAETRVMLDKCGVRNQEGGHGGAGPGQWRASERLTS